jgi:hypothetical protein
MATEVVTPHMTEAFASHTLQCVVETPIQCYLMRRKADIFYLTWITFTPAGIAIQGDCTPGGNGTVSVFSSAYDLPWFAKELAPSYLAEKFLKKSFHRELAQEALRNPIDHGLVDDPEDPAFLKSPCGDEKADRRRAAQLAELAYSLGSDVEYDRRWLCEQLDELGYHSDSYGHIGCDYDPGELGWLCALQRCFVRLYAALPT